MPTLGVPLVVGVTNDEKAALQGSVGSPSASNKYLTEDDTRANPAPLTSEPTGFPNLTDSVISFVPGSRTFTIAPAVSSFDTYAKGLKRSYSSAQNVVIPDTTGLHYIYFNASGVLVSSLIPWSFGAGIVMVATVYWNTAVATQYVLGEERHGLVMDWRTHQYLHETRRTVYVSGFALSGYTLDDDSDASVTVGLGNGVIDDEDLRHSIVHAASPSNPFEQVLADPAQIPVYHRSGSGGAWVKDAATDFYFKNVVTGTLRVAFNSVSGSVWGQTEVDNNDFVAAWIFATNDPNEPIIAVQGQRQDATTAIARVNNGFNSLNLGDLPAVEWKILYRIILQTGNGLGGTRKAQVTAVDDYRTASLLPGVATPAISHNSLADTQVGDDHPQYQLRAEKSVANGYPTLDGTTKVPIGELPVSALDGEVLRLSGTSIVGVTGSDAGSALFGADYVTAFDATVRSSGSTGWNQGVRLSTGAIPAGTYRVGWSFNWNHDDKGSKFQAQVEQSDTTQIHFQEHRPVQDGGAFGATGTDEKYHSSGFAYVTLGAGSYTFDLDFSSNVAGKTSSMWDARIEFWRVA